MSGLQSFLSLLERHGELARIPVEVDPVLEITEIAIRAVKAHKPALLFERVKGSPYPAALNLLASDKRVELALGRHPQQIGAEIKRLLEAAMPPRPQRLLEEWRVLGRVLAMAPRCVTRAACQEIIEAPQLERLPILQCWPKDAGKFLTCGLVVTYDPETCARNIGIYRLQVVGPDQTLMHWQIQKGGGFHYWKAEQQGRVLPVAVAIGTDPILTIAAVAPLPEGIDELAFAGFLRGRAVPITGGKSQPMAVPAEAEFILEGTVAPGERRPEGPFGDHFGHYSHPAPFPVFRIEKLTRRRHPIYAAQVVGKPPQEDRYIGSAVQEMMLPMAKLIHPELRDLWAYYETGFHSLAVASVRNRFGKEGMKTALGLMGTGQMALTKCIILVDDQTDARDFTAVLHALRDRFDPSRDFLLLPGVPFDTLDFTSFTPNLGSKMVLDASRCEGPAIRHPAKVDEAQVTSLHPRIRRTRLLEGALLAVQVQGAGRDVLEVLVKAPALSSVTLVAIVSEDVDLGDQESLLWGLFTRFDPARDVLFADTELKGAWPVYRGVLGIDATFKAGYPDPVLMDERVVELVNRRWAQYWHA
jgi:4-hydroxy-3-polyprenylbenzoate decarboxylase